MKRILPILVLMALAIGGCMSVEPDIQTGYTAPDVYQEILKVYEQGQSYMGLEFIGSTATRLSFHDKSIEIPRYQLMVYKRDEDPVISKKNRCWAVDGNTTGIWVNESASDKAAYPFYLCEAAGAFYVYLSNGNTLVFPSYADEYGNASNFMIPEVHLYVDGTVERHSYIDGKVSIKDASREYSDSSYLTVSMQIKGRGNTTWNSPKKPYHIKFNESHEVLGMPANRDWALISNYNDKTLIRNLVGMELSRIVGMDWTPRCRVVEMYFNEEYQGLYNLFEHKEVAKNKVNINPVAEDVTSGAELDGDYYLEIESSVENMVDPTYFISQYGSVICFNDPECPNEQQQAYIRKIFSRFELALRGTGFNDKEEGYPAYIDVDSFVNFFIVQELSKNIDGNCRKSSYMTKEYGKKLRFCHVWDYDMAFGVANYFPSDEGNGGNGPTGWWVKCYGPGNNYKGGWYYRLFQDPSFVRKVKKRWEELYPELSLVPDYMDYEVARMGTEAIEKNFNKWNILGSKNYEYRVNELKEFYTTRLEWMNSEISNW